ncbi:MAG: PaaI family thioesterase [Desulfobacterales bacterium]|nr:MAG: PaaI family thioesterase [Desulfobacterales bacterium]
MTVEGDRYEVNKEEHYRKLERMYASGPVNEYYAPKIRVGQGRAEVIVPVRQDFFHAAGAVHGSVYFKALDDAAFFAVNSLVKDVFVLTVSFNVYLIRPISEGEIKATGRVIHRSRRLFLAEAELVDSKDREIGRGSGTFMRSTMPLSPDIGYA